MSEKVRRTTATYKQYPHWARGPAKVEGGHVVLDEERAQPYYIYEDDGLLFDLLDLYRPQALDANEVVTFVRRRGLLYQGDHELGSGECREPLDQWHDDLAYLNLAGGVYMDRSKRQRAPRPNPYEASFPKYSPTTGQSLAIKSI